ncbi:hypothetical protein [Enterococcus timonensis]|uniref:hypothetical protein n=1 Tax=Enterococcus timonensis TaxID=1852364 RepID=UPI0008DA4E25|nr:hypothetical protein [Enterococcus timonensis]
MKEFTVVELEDYFTSKLSGITIVNKVIEFPDEAKALYIEGEKDYYLLENKAGQYRFTDGNLKVIAAMEDSLESFLANIVRHITDDEATFDM